MYDGPSYDHSAPRGASQPARPKMSVNYPPNENYPNLMYGQMTQPAAGPGRPYYSSEMQTMQTDRRPLQQIENPSLIGNVAQRHQQQKMAQTLHGYSQPQMCQPLERQLSGERPYSQVLSPSESMGYQQHGTGYYGGPSSYPMDVYSQESRPHSQASYGSGSVMPVMDSQRRGYAPEVGHPVMYCEQPPAAYSNFTPSFTSSPTNLTPPVQRSYDRQNSFRVEPVSVAVAEHQRAPPQTQPPPAYQHQPPPGQGPQGQWARPTGLVTFAQPTPATPVPPQWPAPSRSSAPHTSSTGLSANSKPSTPCPSPRPTTPALAKGAPSTGSSTPSTSVTSGGSERGGFRSRQVAAPERGIRVLTGMVDNILTWGKKLDEGARSEILFEIVGCLDSVVTGQWHSSRLVCLRSLETANTLTAVFWEIDAPLFPPPNGSLVACICRLGVKWPQKLPASRRMPRMHMIKMKIVSPGQVANYKRLAYVSSQSVQHGALSPAPTDADKQPAGSTSPAPLKQTLISSYGGQRKPGTSPSPQQR